MADQQNQTPGWTAINAFVDEYIDGYEFRGDPGDHTPTEFERLLITDAIGGILSEPEFLKLLAGVAQGQEAEPVAVVGADFDLFWAGSGPIAPLVERNGIKVGTKLYAHPPSAQAEQSFNSLPYEEALSELIDKIDSSIDSGDILADARQASGILSKRAEPVGGADGLPDSPTKGMTLGERIRHVGGRENAQGYIEFGSPMAVAALIEHVLRDLTASTPQGAFQARYRLPGGEWSSWGAVICGVKGHEQELRYLETEAKILPSGNAGELPIELQGIAETLRGGDGTWRSCSGCHELNEGHDTGPMSKVFGCALGGGCSECGGIGAVWDTTDYAAMGDYLAAQAQPPASRPEGVTLDGCLETLFVLGEYLGVDYAAARKAPGAPSGVYIQAIEARAALAQQDCAGICNSDKRQIPESQLRASEQINTAIERAAARGE